MDNETQKKLGAYYTDALVSKFLVTWAVRDPQDLVMDPAFGDGVFLQAALERLSRLNAKATSQVLGFEINPDACHSASRRLAHQYPSGQATLQCGNFFELAPAELQVTAIVGNPPFVRYQRFNGENRKLALKRAQSQGVPLSQLASSWAPFLVHAISMVRPGGRLAMVAPFELCHASYARPVLQHLLRSFGRVTLLTFQKKLFHKLNEETLLVLADDKDSTDSVLCHKDYSGPQDIAEVLGKLQEKSKKPSLDLELGQKSLVPGQERLITFVLPEKIRTLYERLKNESSCRKLGNLASVGIGYVTGANDYFHMSPSDAKRWQIPDLYLRRSVRRGRALHGIEFTGQDWEEKLRHGESGCLLAVGEEAYSSLPKGVRQYLNHGVKLGIPNAFKCRTRSPWYKVPNVYKPDAFLSYMSGAYPKLVANTGGMVAPNSLHIIRLSDASPVSAKYLSAVWHNSLTRLSVEIEGHSLGGGMLKMEPTEAKSTLIPISDNPCCTAVFDEIDRLCRNETVERARDIIDKEILQNEVGLSKRECELLRRGGHILAERRAQRGRTPGSGN